MGVNSLPKTVTRQRRDCDLNPGPSAPESSTLTTRLPIHRGPFEILAKMANICVCGVFRCGQTIVAFVACPATAYGCALLQLVAFAYR